MYRGGYRARTRSDRRRLTSPPSSPVIDGTVDGNAVARKVALHFLPLVGLFYIVLYLDRLNIGVAALTMNDELGISRDRVRLRRGGLLLELHDLRATQKVGAHPGRGPEVDLPDHGHLGPRDDRDGIRPGRAEPRRHAQEHGHAWPGPVSA
jgi:hypothetical protein